MWLIFGKTWVAIGMWAGSVECYNGYVTNSLHVLHALQVGPERVYLCDVKLNQEG